MLRNVAPRADISIRVPGREKLRKWVKNQMFSKIVLNILNLSFTTIFCSNAYWIFNLLNLHAKKNEKADRMFK